MPWWRRSEYRRMALKIEQEQTNNPLKRKLTSRGRGRRLVGCTTWSCRLSSWRGGGSTMRGRYTTMGLRVRSSAVCVGVRLRQRVKRLVEHVRRISLGALLKTASTHWPAQAARHRAANRGTRSASDQNNQHVRFVWTSFLANRSSSFRY